MTPPFTRRVCDWKGTATRAQSEKTERPWSHRAFSSRLLEANPLRRKNRTQRARRKQRASRKKTRKCPRLPKPRTPWITCRRRGKKSTAGWRSSWRDGRRGPSSPGSPCPPSTRKGSAPLRRATWQPWTTKWKRAKPSSASTSESATASVLFMTLRGR